MFRPCIDLHEGKVKQIVGGTLGSAADLRTNYVSNRPAAFFAKLYKRDELKGGHVIMLGPGNESEARAALKAYPAGLQIGGGINASNSLEWLDAGASHVIVTSWIFPNAELDWERLSELKNIVGKERLVLDLSCRRRGDKYFVVTNRWHTFTNFELNAENFQKLADYCAEFLIHAVDVEGLCNGIELDLVKRLSEWAPLPTTYAGGANSLQDLHTVEKIGRGKIDLTIGSALDIFGGSGVRYGEAVAYNRNHA
jgi:phosphoribosylformimino-5-aminoimidazole carboxamide ribotide isomerase